MKPIFTIVFVFGLLSLGCGESSPQGAVTGEDSAIASEDTNGPDTDTALLCDPAQCDDGNPCSLNGCADGGCFTEYLIGEPCEDSNVCTENTSCQTDGSCAGGENVTCEDGLPCTIDECDVETGCQFQIAAAGSPCNDGNPCTFPDACDGKECYGAPVLCEEDGSSCQVLTGCSTEDGSCLYSDKANMSPCDDGDLCTEGDSCASGVCVAGGALECLDNNPCTDDFCSPKTGCTFAPNQLNCDDGDPCTQGDNCGFGSCSGEPVDCEDNNPCTFESCDTVNGGCIFTFPSVPCDDGNPCTVGDLCTDGLCASGSPQTCDDQNPCTTDTCQLETGGCTFEPNENPCDDGDACTGQDGCNLGNCIGTPVNCDDNNPCTSDTCSSLSGCAHAPSSGECDDGNKCTLGDLCVEGACTSGTPLSCNDNNPCTTDICPPDTGGCSFLPTNEVCSDNDACTEEDTCVGGECVGILGTCDDDNPCTNDACDSIAGCISTPTLGVCDDGDLCSVGDFCADGECSPGTTPLCDDGNPCSFDLCNGETGDCGAIPQPGDCDDGNPCTNEDSCVDLECVGIEVVPDDGNPCTLDSCDPTTGQVFTPAEGPCDDGDICTEEDACSDGVCTGGEPVNCDDGNTCTTDNCEAQSGCVYTPNELPCDDGDACTEGEQCEEEVCAGGLAITCDDENPCTTDACVVGTGCVYSPTPAQCDDGDPCTESDTCLAGACLGGFPISCDDGNGCTNETCIEGIGCVTSPVTGECDDLNACTLGDTCASGTCLGAIPLDCSDGDACTDDLCDATSGCLNPFNTDGCDDGDACSSEDACSEGICQGTLTVCDDDNPCTTDSCEPLFGCAFVPNLGPCDDGSLCTSNESCLNGLCSGGEAVSCNDGNPCTTDTCLPEEGCSSTPNTNNCSDGDACTEGDVCTDGICESGTPVECGDDAPCTLYACNPALGCVPTFTNSVCDDEDNCTTGETCVEGECTGGAVIPCDDGNPCTDDFCDPATGCSYTNNAEECDDGDSCTTVGNCSGGTCQGGESFSCNDNNACTSDTCDSVQGCTFLDISANCDDGLSCTDDSCETATGCMNIPNDTLCSTGEPCKTDFCSPLSGCVSENNNDPCDDSNACTAEDVCSGGLCGGGLPVNCDDDNPCTDDSCDESSGCSNTPNTSSCDDGDACTTQDSCVNGACTAGDSVECDDGNECTLNSCDSTLGCLQENSTALCDDGTVCTTVDLCSGGICLGLQPLSCGDGKACTEDGCDPVTGCFNNELETACEDGNACTENDTCLEGECVSGALAVCNDENECTLDTCDANLGCVYTPSSAPCDDGNLCTADDTCVAGNCEPGAMVLCDDCDACTTDTCYPAVGCIHEVAPLPCSDGDGCTQNDTCIDGTCVGSTCADAGLECQGTQCGIDEDTCFSLALPGNGAGMSFYTDQLSGDFTIEFRVWLNDLALSPASTHLFFVEGTDQNLILKAQSNGLWSISWGVTGEESPTSWNGIGQNAALTNQWIHVAVSYEQSTGTRRLFIDGVVKGSDTGVAAFAPGEIQQAHLGRGPEPVIAYPTVNGRLRWARISSSARYNANFAPLPEPREADAWTENLYLMRTRPDSLVPDDGFLWRHGNISGGEWVALDGSPITDQDGDGYAPCEGDCNDNDAFIHPGRGEVCGDGIDNDCDGITDSRDFDGDGFEGCSLADCNDFAATTYPGAIELPDDGLDNNCDGNADSLDTDEDKDGWTENQGDCNDGAPWIHPAAQDIPLNGVDEDCNGSDSDFSNLTAPALFVDGATGSDFFDGSIGFPKKTLNAALSSATPGTLIAVTAGSYPEDITLKDVHLAGGFSSSWVGGGGTTHITGTIQLGVLQTTDRVLSGVRVTGLISAAIGAGGTLLDIEGEGLEGPILTTNSRGVVVAQSQLHGTGSGPSEETPAIEVGSGGIQLWNSTVIAGTGSDGEDGTLGICCGIEVSSGTSGGKGESLYALQRSDIDTKTCCDSDLNEPGCGNALCEDCVCSQAPSCCTGAWTPACVAIAQSAPCSILGCAGCPGETSEPSIVSGSFLQGGIAGNGGTGGNAFNGAYYCGTPGEGGDATTIQLDSGRIQGSAIHAGIAGDGASQVGVIGFSATCNGGDGGRTTGILGQNLELETVTIVAVNPPTLSVGGQPAAPVSESPQGPQTFEEGQGGILEGVVLEGTSELKRSRVLIAGRSGKLREVTGVEVNNGAVHQTRVRMESASYGEGIYATGNSEVTNSLIHTLLYPGSAVVSDSVGLLLSSSTLVTESPGFGLFLEAGAGQSTLVNNIVATGFGGTCIQNEGSQPSEIKNNLLDGCAEQLYFDGLYRTQPLELDFLLGGENSGGHQFTDPAFVGITEENFELASCSPAIDAGIDASNPEWGGITEDLIRQARPFGAIHDIGAYEYTSPSIDD